jgi:hypothetical protein
MTGPIKKEIKPKHEEATKEEFCAIPSFISASKRGKVVVSTVLTTVKVLVVVPWKMFSMVDTSYGSGLSLQLGHLWWYWC